VAEVEFLDELRNACGSRQVEWPNADKFDLSFYGLEFVAEAGELGNKLKKVVRADLNGGGSQTTAEEIGDEVADVLITLMNALNKLEERYGIGVDIIKATRVKFNAGCEERGFATKL